jgi:hypothetical protein
LGITAKSGLPPIIMPFSDGPLLSFVRNVRLIVDDRQAGQPAPSHGAWRQAERGHSHGRHGGKDATTSSATSMNVRDSYDPMKMKVKIDPIIRDGRPKCKAPAFEPPGRNEPRKQVRAKVWWAVQVSNLRPPACKADALPLS